MATKCQVRPPAHQVAFQGAAVRLAAFRGVVVRLVEFQGVVGWLAALRLEAFPEVGAAAEEEGVAEEEGRY